MLVAEIEALGEDTTAFCCHKDREPVDNGESEIVKRGVVVNLEAFHPGGMLL